MTREAFRELDQISTRLSLLAVEQEDMSAGAQNLQDRHGHRAPRASSQSRRELRKKLKPDVDEAEGGDQAPRKTPPGTLFPHEEPCISYGGHESEQRHDEDERPLHPDWRYTRKGVQSRLDQLDNTSSPVSLGNQVSIKGPPDGWEAIEARFRQQSSNAANKFFRIGRVFAILWHIKDSTTMEGHSDSYKTAAHGERILTSVMRMAVVKVGHGFCWAIPIHSYGGAGLRKKGLNDDDKQAHAILHMEDQKPAIFKDEPVLKKTPIAVRMSGGQRLHPASRINFAKIHTVEQNIKVHDIGIISPTSMPYFTTYFREHLTL
jgi:hypothetical protein